MNDPEAAPEGDQDTSVGIRSYGPGKYDRIIDVYAHALTMDGGTEEIGDVSETGWFGLVDGAGILTDMQTAAEEDGEDFTEDEVAFLKDVVGFIVSENDQGFVTVDYYEDKAQLKEDWEKIKAEIEEVYSQQEQD